MAWNGSGTSTRNTSASNRVGRAQKKSRGILAGVSAVIIAGAAICFFLLRSDGPKIEQTGGTERTLTSSKSAALSEVESAKPISRPDKIAERQVAIEKAKAEFVKRPGALQLPDGQVLTFPVPKEGETRTVYAYGHSYVCDHLGNFTDVTPRQLFHTAFEANFLALAQADKPFIPAFLTGLDEKDVRAMLSKEYEPIGDETDDEKAQLKAYDDLRQSVLAYMDQGGSFDEFVQDVAKTEKKQRETQAVSMREIMTLYKEGQVAEAKEMAEAANKLMEQKGYKPIKLPPHVKAAFDELAPAE